MKRLYLKIVLPVFALCALVVLLFALNFAFSKKSVEAVSNSVNNAQLIAFPVTAQRFVHYKMFDNSKAIPLIYQNSSVFDSFKKKTTGYRQYDAFINATNQKGQQYMEELSSESYHSLLNMSIDDYIDINNTGTFDYTWEYEYEGEIFYVNLSGIEAFLSKVKHLNYQNISVSVVFLVQYKEGREFLIDEMARIKGRTFYAPATTGVGAKAIRAFFDFLLWRCDVWNASIDNFILGNEINDPNNWHYSGTIDANIVAANYASTFRDMYNIVRKYTDISRCSFSLDHNWTHTNLGRQISGRTMLHAVDDALNSLQPDIEWYLSYHMYPSIMHNNAIWRKSGYNTQSPNAMFIDAMNLNILTDYIVENFGEQHRVMLTEQGFTLYNGNEEEQATALALSYFAAKYNPMVDNFILYQEYHDDKRMDFTITGHLAETVFNNLENGNEQDLLEIEQLILNTTGIDVRDLIPNYGVVQEETVVNSD